MDAIGEQQLKRTQAASSSRNRGATAEVDAIREHAAAEADAIGEQQLKRTQAASSTRNCGAAAKADAIEEHQLCTESCLAPDYSRRRMRGK